MKHFQLQIGQRLLSTEENSLAVVKSVSLTCILGKFCDGSSEEQSRFFADVVVTIFCLSQTTNFLFADIFYSLGTKQFRFGLDQSCLSLKNGP